MQCVAGQGLGLHSSFTKISKAASPTPQPWNWDKFGENLRNIIGTGANIYAGSKAPQRAPQPQGGFYTPPQQFAPQIAVRQPSGFQLNNQTILIGAVVAVGLIVVLSGGKR